MMKVFGPNGDMYEFYRVPLEDRYVLRVNDDERRRYNFDETKGRVIMDMLECAYAYGKKVAKDEIRNRLGL